MRIVAGIGDARGRDVRNQRHGGRLQIDLSQGFRHFFGGRLHQGAMERRADGQQHAALGALRLGDLNGALDGGLDAGDHDLSAAIVVRRLADVSLRGFPGDFRRRVEFEPEQNRHRALPDRHGALHGLSALFQQAGGVGKREGAGGGERRVFAERVAGDEGGLVGELEAARLFQRADDGEADGHDGGLGILGERQVFLRAFPHQFGELLAQSLVDLLEDLTGGSESLGQFAAHADGLRSLPRKDESSATSTLPIIARPVQATALKPQEITAGGGESRRRSRSSIQRQLPGGVIFCSDK